MGVGLQLVGEEGITSISSNCDLIGIAFCLLFQGLWRVKKAPAFFLVRMDFEVLTGSGEMVCHMDEPAGRLVLKSNSAVGHESSSWLELLLPLPPDMILSF